MRTRTVWLTCLIGASSLASAAGLVNDDRVLDEESTGNNWLISGGNFRGDHFSPLDSVNESNVAELGLSWSTDIPIPDGIAGTPLVVDGVIYLSTAYSHVYAISAKTGDILWTHRPMVEEALTNDPSLSWIARGNRGAAVWDGSVYVATADCRLVSLDASNGKERWTKKTCDPDLGYAISDAPHVGGGKVFVGNAGSESGEKNRGYVSAYDADSGEMIWRFHVVPSSNSEENTSDAMKMAAATWDGDALEKFGGGGSNWNEMTYDASSDMLFFGTGGALPYMHHERSPKGLDNLFTSSVVAVNASNGEYVWHYQTVPEDSWEYNATMNIVLTTLRLGDTDRDVAMIAPKNGFFYVLDKMTGELLSAEKFGKVTWATHINLETGRPNLDPAGKYWELDDGETSAIWPNMWGAHSWQPMAYHPGTGLAYIPLSDVPEIVTWYDDGEFDDTMQLVTEVDGKPFDPGKLLAWDPVRQEARWSVPRKLPFNGGILATAGNLVFQGDAEGYFSAHAADDGELLWQVNTGSAINSAPVTFTQDGQQMVLIAVGAGGGMQYSYPELHASNDVRGPTRVMAFSRGDDADMPVVDSTVPVPPQIDADEITAEVAEFGAELYEGACGFCHGKDAAARHGGSVPDLRYASEEVHLTWNGIVIGGSRIEKGMPNFDFDPREADAIRLYVLSQSRALTESLNQR